MKYVQIGILVCLMVIAGLLFGIYQGQRGTEPKQPGVEPISLEEAPLPPPDLASIPAAEEPAEIVQAKPSPLPPTTSNRRPQAAPKPAPAPPAPSPDTSEVEPYEEPEYLPPPVTEPVIPNLPPMVEAPEPEPVPAPQPQLVTVPEGTELYVRMINTLSTNRNLPGDKFEATLERPIAVNGWLIAAKGSRVEGRVLESKKAGRVKGLAELSFDLVSLTTADGRSVDISTAAYGEAGEKTRGEDLKKIGWGAGIGAIIGAIAGGGKGAAIGAGAGAGAGAGTVIATRGETVVVPTESRLTFRLAEPVEVTSTKQVNL